MKPEYKQWIEDSINQESPLGKCALATLAMVEDFPELKRVRGFYNCPFWGKRTHWWCVAPDGLIVDPTAAQFPSLGSGNYQEWIEGQDEPTGKCHNCGVYIYDEGRFCSNSCEKEVMNSLRGWDENH